MDSIDRLALIVMPRQPYYDWAKALDNGGDLVEITKNQPTVYLVYVIEDHDSLEDLLEMYHEDIFDAELAYWWRDKSKWPSSRTVELFREWFTVSVSTLVFDMEDEPIEYS